MKAVKKKGTIIYGNLWAANINIKGIEDSKLFSIKFGKFVLFSKINEKTTLNKLDCNDKLILS
jgi:hypothetical protein